MRPRRFRLLATMSSTIVAIAFCAIAAHAQTEAPTIYKWVDEHGIAHYTTDRDRIPSVIRDRVESVAAKASPGAPAVAGQPSREDLMRDAVRTTPNGAAASAPVATNAPIAAAVPVEAIAAPSATPIAATEATATPGRMPEAAPETMPSDTAVEDEAAVAAEPELAPEPEPTEIASPAPVEPDLREDNSSVSAAPPAAPIELEATEQAAVVELDQQIEGVQTEIAQREETLAALISTSDEERTMPLVDDPAFREISQTLPKLQADLQTLRERRNKIQPIAPTP